MSNSDRPKALFFDVFGTVVDWRRSIISQLLQFGEENGIEADWTKFADAWRSYYQPSMEAVRSGKRAWVNLDQLHLESLQKLAEDYDLAATETSLKRLSKAWHFLDPWPDSVEGLQRLKSRFIISTMSNGNTSLLTNMAKHSNLPWDVILGAETANAYKPTPESYLRNIGLLDLVHSEVMMVAAHNSDLEAAQGLGMKTAFVCRPNEHGSSQAIDLKPTGDWDYAVDSFTELADRIT